MIILNIYSTLLVQSVLKIMSISINYKAASKNHSSSNVVLFVDEKYSISSLKKHVSNNEFSFISDLFKSKDPKKKILDFDINSKKKIILISLKKKLSNSDAENLGAKFFVLFNDFKQNNFIINSETLSDKSKYFLGYFLHGLRLKSYKLYSTTPR